MGGGGLAHLHPSLLKFSIRFRSDLGQETPGPPLQANAFFTPPSMEESNNRLREESSRGEEGQGTANTYSIDVEYGEEYHGHDDTYYENYAQEYYEEQDVEEGAQVEGGTYHELREENDRLKAELGRLQQASKHHVEGSLAQGSKAPAAAAPSALDQEAIVEALKNAQRDFLAQSQRDLEQRMLQIMEKVVESETRQATHDRSDELRQKRSKRGGKKSKKKRQRPKGERKLQRSEQQEQVAATQSPFEHGNNKEMEQARARESLAEMEQAATAAVAAAEAAEASAAAVTATDAKEAEGSPGEGGEGGGSRGEGGGGESHIQFRKFTEEEEGTRDQYTYHEGGDHEKEQPEDYNDKFSMEDIDHFKIDEATSILLNQSHALLHDASKGLREFQDSTRRPLSTQSARSSSTPHGRARGGGSSRQLQRKKKSKKKTRKSKKKLTRSVSVEMLGRDIATPAEDSDLTEGIATPAAAPTAGFRPATTGMVNSSLQQRTLGAVTMQRRKEIPSQPMINREWENEVAKNILTLYRTTMKPPPEEEVGGDGGAGGGILPDIHKRGGRGNGKASQVESRRRGPGRAVRRYSPQHIWFSGTGGVGFKAGESFCFLYIDFC